MDSDGIDRLNFKSSTLQVINEESKRGRSIGSRKDVFVHEKTPDQILILPRLTKPSNLQEKDSIVIKHVINLLQERLEVADADVLCHLKTSDFVVFAFWNWNIAVIHAEDSALLFCDTGFAEAVVSPGSLVTTKGNTSNIGTKVDTGKLSQSTPATSDIKHALILLQINLLAYDGKLVILKFFKSFLLVDVGDNTGGVNHTWAEEPSIEIIASIIVISDLLLIFKNISRQNYK